MTRSESLKAKYGESYFADIAKKNKNAHRLTSETARLAQQKSVEKRRENAERKKAEVSSEAEKGV